MKSGTPEKKKTLKLKIEDHINFKIIGISSHENDYRLVWSINEMLKIQFVRIENLVLHNQKLKEDLEFSRFVYHDEDRYLKYFLISNRCPNGFLFSEVKNLDFVLQILGVINETALTATIKKLQSVPVVAAAFMLQPETIKGIGNILAEN